MSVIEMTTVTVIPQNTKAMLAARPGMVAAFRADRRGFVGARLVRVAENTWLDFVEWTDDAAWDESKAKGANLPAIAAFFGTFDKLVGAERGLRYDDVQDGPRRVRTIAYGPEPSQVGELYLPEDDGPFPVVVVVHGGCWTAIWDRRQTTAVVDDLVTRGYAVWNIEYRRIGEPGGGWPAPFSTSPPPSTLSTAWIRRSTPAASCSWTIPRARTWPRGQPTARYSRPRHPAPTPRSPRRPGLARRGAGPENRRRHRLRRRPRRPRHGAAEGRVRACPAGGVPAISATAGDGIVQLLLSGRFAGSRGRSGTVQIWDITNRSQPTPIGPPLQAHNAQTETVAFNPDSSILATGGGDGAVHLWDVRTPSAPVLLSTPGTFGAFVNEVAFSPNGELLVAGSTDRTVRIWDITAPQAPRRSVHRSHLPTTPSIRRSSIATAPHSPPHSPTARSRCGT